MNEKRKWMMTAVVATVFFGLPGWGRADQIFKANNTLPLNDPLSWEGNVVPGADDVAVFDERVVTNTLTFPVTDNLAWRGMVFTNQTETPAAVIGTASFVTNGADAATLTLGTNGVCVSGAGVALNLALPLVLSGAQTWQMDNRNLTFNDTVSGASDWTLNRASQTVWTVTSGYNGKLVFSNSPVNTTAAFYTTGRWAKSLTGDSGRRFELRHTGTALWSTLFSDRTATANYWMGIESFGTVQLEAGDTLSVPNNYFAVDRGYMVQNGGTVNCSGLFMEWGATAGSRYTVNGGTLTVGSRGIDLGDTLSSINATARLLQTGGVIEAPQIKVGRSNLSYFAAPVYELTGGVFRITGTRGADTGIHLSWNGSGSSGAECSGAFLMEGGWADADQVALGRSDANTYYAVTNAFSLFKMTGGELVLGSYGLYAGRSWNNGITNSGYAVKLSGGTLTAGESWTSSLDICLDDRNGGVAFNTEDANGAPRFVTLNGAVYGPGGFTKRGAGTLLLAGEASYEGPTVVEEGTLKVGRKADLSWWRADALTGTNLTPVTAWLDLSGGATAANADAAHAPRLITNALNGHNVVRFTNTSAITQYLAVAASESPISGATAFSIAVVFKTGSAGTGDDDYWYHNSGFVDAEQGGYQNDWGMAFSASGRVSGGAGYPNVGDVCAYSPSGTSLADSQPHVAIFMWRETNVWLNVDGHVTSAARTGVTSVNPRNTYRLLLGSMCNLYYFNGDMAEIRIYRNRVLSSDEQNALGAEMAATYGVTGAAFGEPAASAPVSGTDGVVALPSAGAYDTLPYDAAVWDADTLTGTQGSAVSEWATTNGDVTASLSAAGVSGAVAPSLQLAAFNGHNAVRFDASLKNVLGISSGQSPIAGVTNFSAALVFCTETGGKTADQWYNSVGLIDAEQGGATYDWGIAFTADGRVAAGIGNSDKTVFSKPFDLCDGLPHVAVVSYDAVGGYTTVMADGLSVSRNVGVHAAARNVYRVLVGSLNALAGQFFTGDLATFRLYPGQALTGAEMTSLSTELALKYGIRFVSYGNASDPQPTGLGSGDVNVAAGATLLLPSVTNAPVTLVSGQTISGGGAVRGTLALDAGATLDIGQSEVLTLDALRLRDGATVRWHHSGGVGSTLSVESLFAAGTVTVDVAGGSNLPVRVSILAYTSGEHLDEAVWSVAGAKKNTRVEVNAATMTVDLVTPRGTILTVR